MFVKIDILNQTEELRRDGLWSTISFLTLTMLARLLSMLPAVSGVLILAKLLDGTFGAKSLFLFLSLSALSLILSSRISKALLLRPERVCQG